MTLINTLSSKFNRHARLLSVVVYGYLLIMLLCVSVPYWPESLWNVATLISFSPLWLLLIPPLLLLPLCLLLKRYKQSVVLLLAVVMSVRLLGWVTSIPPELSELQAENAVTVLTANMGGASVDALNQLIVENNADLIALQEITETQLLPLLLMSPLHHACHEALCFLSSLDFTVTDTKTREVSGYQRPYLMQVSVKLPSSTLATEQNIDFFVVHQVTPREGFAALLSNPVRGWSTLTNVIEGMRTESWIASSTVMQGKRFIAAGDFNLPSINPLFQKYWRWAADSFQESGNGFGFSKHTRVHGVQIDHVLHSPEWTAVKTRVGPSLGGDHSPIITVLAPALG